MANAKENAKVTETINGNLVLVREPIMENGKQKVGQKSNRLMFSYKVYGMAAGKWTKADFLAKDMGGYEPLDILFDVSDKVELIAREQEMVDSFGNKTRYMTYIAQTVGEDGEVWDCPVRPAQESDKTLLKYMLIDLRKKQK